MRSTVFKRTEFDVRNQMKINRWRAADSDMNWLLALVRHILLRYTMLLPRWWSVHAKYFCEIRGGFAVAYAAENG